jgi:GNAT superfamily N-acetyltransferase
VHISIREALGPELNDALQPDWRAMQQRDVQAVLSAPTSNVWVADADAIIAGFVAVRIQDDRRIDDIDMLAVDPPQQGTGIGTALTKFALDWIRASGIGVAMVGPGADPGHAPARRAYEKAGMTLVPMALLDEALTHAITPDPRPRGEWMFGYRGVVVVVGKMTSNPGARVKPHASPTRSLARLNEVYPSTTALLVSVA